MARDAELDLLKKKRRLALENQRDAFTTLSIAREGYGKAKDFLRRAHMNQAMYPQRLATANRRLNTAKTALDRAQAAAKRATRHADSVVRQTRLQKRKRLAEMANVPREYITKRMNLVFITRDSDGTSHFYFGGLGYPLGPQHAHYVMDAAGRLTYRREPGARHGAHNHIEHRPEKTYA